MLDARAPRSEHPSAYLVQDRSNREEMRRLEIQDRMLTTSMGGVLPEVADPAGLRRVLDVGCGTGGWLIETARAYPQIETLVGIDVSHAMVEYAQAQAQANDLGLRVRLQARDALCTLGERGGFFDLVNQRLGSSWLRTWEWRKILLEYERVTRPGGILRITEGQVLIESRSPALTKLCGIMLAAFANSGRLFAPSSDGLTSKLELLLTQHGFEDVQTRVSPLVYRADTEQGKWFYQNMFYGFRVMLPFVQKWTRLPDDYQELCQQVLKEMRQPDFEATWTIVTVWGIRHVYGGRLLMRGLL